MDRTCKAFNVESIDLIEVTHSEFVELSVKILKLQIVRNSRNRVHDKNHLCPTFSSVQVSKFQYKLQKPIREPESNKHNAILRTARSHIHAHCKQLPLILHQTKVETWITKTSHDYQDIVPVKHLLWTHMLPAVGNSQKSTMSRFPRKWHWFRNKLKSHLVSFVSALNNQFSELCSVIKPRRC